MRNFKRYLLAAGIAAVSMLAAGCSGSSSGASDAPRVAYTELRDEAVLPDTAGAEIEVLNLESPIDYCYSSSDTDMVFKMKDGVWLDGMDSTVPLNQERFQAMADNFLKLKAVSEVDAPASAEDYGLVYPLYTFYITDGARGEIYISVGSQDSAGNYYVSLENGKYYTIKSSTVDSIIFDYDSLVVRDSLDLTVTADQIKKATVTKNGKTTKYKTSDTEAMTRIAEGLSTLKPVEFASFHATNQELVAAELSEDKRMTLNAELEIDGETRSITVYVGTFVDVMGERRYVQLDGSQMISVMESPVIGNLLNLTEEENTI